jgi:hypothetical protein
MLLLCLTTIFNYCHPKIYPPVRFSREKGEMGKKIMVLAPKNVTGYREKIQDRARPYSTDYKYFRELRI